MRSVKALCGMANQQYADSVNHAMQHRFGGGYKTYADAARLLHWRSSEPKEATGALG